MARFRFVILGVLLAVMGLACARVVRDEKPRTGLPNAEAERALKKAAKQASEAATEKERAEGYLAVRQTFPESAASQEALYRAGVAFFEAGDFQNARKSFNELLFENPLFEKGDDARLKLGLSALELHAYRDAYHTLSSLAERATKDVRELALEGAAKAANGAGLFGDALRLALRELEKAPSPEEKERLLAKLVEFVEGRVGFLDIAKAREEVSAEHPAWPLLTFKLARIHAHLRDWPRMEGTLKEFLSRAPAHPYAPRAQELLARAQRRFEVKPNVLGIVLPMTGKYKALGEAVMRGVQLALSGSGIEVVVKDSQGDVNLAGKRVEELAFEHGAIAILGPLVNEDARRAALVAEELQVPILALSRGEGLTAIGPHVFRNMLTNSQQAEALAQYATSQLGYKSFAVLYPEVPFGVDLANGFWDRVLARGGEMRGAESYDHDQTTFSSEVKKLVGRYYLEDRGDYLEKAREVMAGPGDAFRKRKAMEKVRASLDPVVDFEALLIPDSWERVSLVAPALAVEDVITNACDPGDIERIRRTTGRKDIRTVTLLGTNTWTSPNGPSGLPKLLERGGKFVTCSVFVDGFFAGSAREATEKFVRAFQERFEDFQPSLYDAIGYDSAGMIREIIEKHQPKTRAALRERLSLVKGFQGATGTTRFDEQRESRKPLFFLTVGDKGLREIEWEEKPGS
jgi:ABC-type branched-subunit amino acid transport system substrate-binding protein